MKNTNTPYHKILLYAGFGIRKAGSITTLASELDVYTTQVESWLAGTERPTQIAWKKLRSYTENQAVEVKPYCLDMVELKHGGSYAIIVPKTMHTSMVEGFITHLNKFMVQNGVVARVMAIPAPVQELTAEDVKHVEEIFETVPGGGDDA